MTYAASYGSVVCKECLVQYDPGMSSCPRCGSLGFTQRMPDPYKSLKDILDSAFEQAACGKGKERHAKEGEAFEDQKICEITRRVGLGYPLGQAIKKAEEAHRMGRDAALRELYGAINYLAAACIVLKEGDED